MELAEAAAVQTKLSTRDADVIADTVSRLFGHHVMLSCGEAEGLRHVVARPVSGILLGDLRYGSNMTCIADEPRAMLCLTVPHESSGRLGRTVYAPGDLLAFNPDWVGLIELTPPGHFLNTCIPDEQVFSGLRALLGVEPDGLPVFRDRLPANSSVASRMHTVFEVLHGAHAESAVLRHLRETWAVIEILEAWPNSYSSRLAGGAQHPRALRRALEFIETHVDKPISVVDVARAACVGVRALNEAFKRHFDSTPGRHIRGRRLDAARLALETDPFCTVADAAARWHFSNPGVFARYFRERFGALPSTFRARAKSRRP